MSREQLLHALSGLGAVGAGLPQQTDGVGAVLVNLQGISKDIDRFVNVIIVAGDLDADARAPNQATNSSLRRSGSGIAAASNFGEKRLCNGFQRGILCFSKEVAGFLFEFD